MPEDPRISKGIWPFGPHFRIAERRINHDPQQGHDHNGIESKYLEVSGVPSSPPSGKCRVINLYVDPATGKLVVEWDDIPEP